MIVSDESGSNFTKIVIILVKINFYLLALIFMN